MNIRFSISGPVALLRQRSVNLALLLYLTTGCQDAAPVHVASETSEGVHVGDEPKEFAGLHNVLRLSDRLYSGSSPEGDSGFGSLKKLGVRTIVTVDGAKPDVERARRFDMRYVHLPVGYDGIPRERALQVARAVRDLPGAVYVHCHHGQHRGPAAAVAAELCLDPAFRVEDGESVLKRAGTEPRYKGLVSLPRSFRRPAKGELDLVSADFPEVATVPDLARLMVEVDGRFDNLKAAREAGWRKPADHPDVDPPHEALMLAEQFREASRLRGENRTEEFKCWLGDAESAALELERILRSSTVEDLKTTELANTSLIHVHATCAKCHAKYRDPPR